MNNTYICSREFSLGWQLACMAAAHPDTGEIRVENPILGTTVRYTVRLDGELLETPVATRCEEQTA